MALSRFMIQAKDIAIEQWGEIYHLEGDYSQENYSKRFTYENIFRVSLYASYVFQSLNLAWALYSQDYVKSSIILGTLTAISVFPAIAITIECILENRSSVSPFLEKGARIYLWTVCIVSGVALGVLGSPLHGMAPLVFSLLSVIYCYKHYQATYALPPAVQKHAEETPEVKDQIRKSALKGRKEIDLPLFINETERLDDGVLAKIDLSNSNFDDRSLIIYISHLFSKQSSSSYPHEIDLSHCPNISMKGVSHLLKDFPKLKLNLTGTPLSSEDVYLLQKKHLAATLHFDTIGQDLLALFEEGSLCDATFKVGQENIHFHKFILAAFNLNTDSKEYVVEGISAEDFKKVLKNLYQGIRSVASFKITCGGKETEVDLEKVNYQLSAKDAFSDVTLNFKGTEISRS